MGEIYNLFGKRSKPIEDSKPVKDSEGSKVYDQESPGSVVSYDRFVAKHHSNKGLPVLSFEIIDFSDQSSLEAIAKKHGKKIDNILLPHDRQSIEGSPLLEKLKSFYPQANFFPTLTDYAYGFHADVSSDYAKCLRDNIVSTFRSYYIIFIMNIFVAQYPKNSFFGSLEEVTHLLKYFEDSKGKEHIDKQHRDFMVSSRILSPEEISFRAYADVVIRKILEREDDYLVLPLKKRGFFKKTVRPSKKEIEFLESMIRDSKILSEKENEKEDEEEDNKWMEEFKPL